MNLRIWGLLLFIVLGALVLETEAALDSEGRELLWKNKEKEKRWKRRHRKHKKTRTSAKPYVPKTTAKPYVPPTTAKPYKPTTAKPYVPPTTAKPYKPTTAKPYVPPTTAKPFKPTTKKTAKPYVPTTKKSAALPAAPSTTRSAALPSVPGAVVLHGEQVEQCANDLGFFKVGGNPPVLDCVCCPGDPRANVPGGCASTGGGGPVVAGIENCASCNDFMVCERCLPGFTLAPGSFTDRAGAAQSIRQVCV